MPAPKRTAKKQASLLSIKQVKQLKVVVRAQYPGYYALILLGLTTGQRFSELSALHWTDIDFDEGVVRFRAAQVEGDRNMGNKVGIAVTEPLFPEVRDALLEHRRAMIEAQHPGVASGIVFPARVDPATAKHGGYMQRWTLNDVLTKACKAAGVPRITPHDFRHNLTTTLVEIGTSKHLVQAIIGHKTDEMTDHYSHVRPEVKAAVLAPVIAAWNTDKGTDEGTEPARTKKRPSSEDR